MAPALTHRDAALPALIPASPAESSEALTPFGRMLSSAEGSRSLPTGKGPGADRERRLKLENSRLREELESLKAMYARRIAHDECRFEDKIRQKDEECERWFRVKKTDIKKMQSALVIMRALFERKRRKFDEEMKAQCDKFEVQKAQWLENMEKLRKETEAEKARCRKELEKKTVEFQVTLDRANLECESLRERVKSLEDSLADKKVECDRLRKEVAEQTKTMEQLKHRLLEVERADELLKRNSQIEALEAELKRTKKLMHERAHAEADALRRELMEYVKFIVHILPEEYQSKAKEMAENPRLAQDKMSGTMPTPPRSAPSGGAIGNTGKSPRSSNPRRKSASQQAQNLYQVPSTLHGHAQAVASERTSQLAEVDGDDF